GDAVAAGGGEAGVGDDGDEHVTGVGDGGIGEHAFKVALEEGEDVADGHGEGGHDFEEAEDGLAVGCGVVKVDEGDGVEDRDDGRGLGGEGEEGGDGRGGALVDVRGVKVEGDGGDFVGDADDHHEEPDGGKGRTAGIGGEPDVDAVKAGLAGGAVEVGEAE